MSVHQETNGQKYCVMSARSRQSITSHGSSMVIRSEAELSKMQVPLVGFVSNKDSYSSSQVEFN